MEKDFLAEVIHERSARNPHFPALVKAAEERRELLLALARKREASGLTQTEVAAAMGTSQSQVARLESAGVDTKPRRSRNSLRCSGSASNGRSVIRPRRNRAFLTGISVATTVR